VLIAIARGTRGLNNDSIPISAHARCFAANVATLLGSSPTRSRAEARNEQRPRSAQPATRTLRKKGSASSFAKTAPSSLCCHRRSQCMKKIKHTARNGDPMAKSISRSSARSRSPSHRPSRRPLDDCATPAHRRPSTPVGERNRTLRSRTHRQPRCRRPSWPRSHSGSRRASCWASPCRLPEPSLTAPPRSTSRAPHAPRELQSRH